MTDKSSRNEGIRMLAQFTDRAVPVGESPADTGPAAVPGASVNEGVRMVATFDEVARPIAEREKRLGPAEVSTLDVAAHKAVESSSIRRWNKTHPPAHGAAAPRGAARRSDYGNPPLRMPGLCLDPDGACEAVGESRRAGWRQDAYQQRAHAPSCSHPHMIGDCCQRL